MEFRIHVALSGRERSEIVTCAAARKAKRTLLFQQKMLHHVKLSDILTPQWHEFKFELEIPPQMPASMRSEEGRKSYAEIGIQSLGMFGGTQTIATTFTVGNHRGSENYHSSRAGSEYCGSLHDATDESRDQNLWVKKMVTFCLALLYKIHM
jgi:hypothetical protein